MPQVYRISQGEKISVFIPDHIWEKIQRKPKVFGRYKWELVPMPKFPIYSDDITKKPSPIYASKKPTFKKPPKESLIVNDDFADVKSETKPYIEKNYRKDLEKAKMLATKGDKENAKLLFERAYKFKKSGYVKGQINKL